MKKFILFTLTASLILSAFIACEDDDGKDSGDPHANDFQVMVITDIHVNCFECDNYWNLMNIVDKINNDEYPEVPFIFVTGDMVNGMHSGNIDDYKNDADYTPSEEDNLQANMYRYIRDRSKVPFYEVLGNHDGTLYDENGESHQERTLRMEAIWKKLLGHGPYYTVEHNGFKFIGLSSNRGEEWTETERGYGAFGEEQLVWLEDELAEGMPSILFFHYPTITDNGNMFPPNHEQHRIIKTDRFYDIAYEYRETIKAIFTGHMHYWAKDTMFDTIPVYLTAGTEILDYLGLWGGDDDFTNNYNLIKCDTVNMTIEVIPGDEDPGGPGY